VSVIITAYNCEDFIAKALESILEQDYKNLEILVSDDCSTDSTKSVIDSYIDSRIKVFHNDKNQGNLITTNKLFGEATGTFITFQDADDWSHPNRIEEQVKLLLNKPTIGLCSTGFARVAENEKLLFNVEPLISHEEILNVINEESHPRMCYASILTYKEIIEEAGGVYRIYFKKIRGADIDFFYRLIDKHKVCNIKDIRYFYRTTKQSITNDVNLRQFYPLIVGPQLSYFLRKQRLENGADAIQTDDFAELKRLEEAISDKYKNNIHKTYAVLAPRWASFQDSKNLLVITKDYMTNHPFSLTTYINISIAFTRLLLREDLYKKISSRLTFLKKIYKKITV